MPSLETRELSWRYRALALVARVQPHERRAVALALACHFVLFASYYILRPLRDTMATLFGTDQLQLLFLATFVGTLIASPIYTAAAGRWTLARLLPGVFWFWLLNVLLFVALFRVAPQSRAVVGAFFVWFSIVNLFIVSVFWTLMVDLFTASQATRLFALIAAGGEVGTITGSWLTRVLAKRVDIPGLLLIAAAGFVFVIGFVHLLMREKRRLRESGDEVQRSTLDHGLSGNPFAGFGALFASRYVMLQAGYILLMTWVNTVAYFLQTDVVARSFSAVAGRVQALADIDLVVNICTFAVLTFGLGRIVQRLGLTTALIINPLLMVLAFIGVLLSPSLLMVQVIQVVRRVAQYAIARPSREICFTVVDQSDRYRTKNVIDTVVYRLGDVGSSFMQAGLRSAGSALAGTVALGGGTSILWAAVAVWLGRRYEQLRRSVAATASASDAQAR